MRLRVGDRVELEDGRYVSLASSRSVRAVCGEEMSVALMKRRLRTYLVDIATTEIYDSCGNSLTGRCDYCDQYNIAEQFIADGTIK